jgi:hypothetical protein
LGPVHLLGFSAPNATNLSILPRNKSNPGVIFPPPKEKRKTTWKNQSAWILSPTKALGQRALQEWS